MRAELEVDRKAAHTNNVVSGHAHCNKAVKVRRTLGNMAPVRAHGEKATKAGRVACHIVVDTAANCQTIHFLFPS